MPHKRITVTGKPSHFPRLTAKILIFIFFTPLASVSWLNARLRCVEMRFWSQTIIFCLLLVFVSMLHNGFKCFLKDNSFSLAIEYVFTRYSYQNSKFRIFLNYLTKRVVHSCSNILARFRCDNDLKNIG